MDYNEVPNEKDWKEVWKAMVIVLDNLGKQIGLPPIPKLSNEPGIPTDAQLDEWEKLIPGSKERLIQMAIKEMNHRTKIKKIRKKRPFNLLKWI